MGLLERISTSTVIVVLGDKQSDPLGERTEPQGLLLNRKDLEISQRLDFFFIPVPYSEDHGFRSLKVDNNVNVPGKF